MNADVDIARNLRRTLALVLAGGRGSRLKALTENDAIPALPFAGKLRLIDFALSNCLNSGIRRIGVLTQYKAHSLIQHLQRGWGFLRGEFDEFIELWPAQQRTGTETWYRGSADAVLQNLDLVRDHAPEHILILAGDHVYKMNYARMLAHHIASGAAVTIGCHEVPLAQASRFGVMSIGEDGQIQRFDEKPANPQPIPGRPDHALVSMGIYLFKPELLYEQLEQDAAAPGSSHEFGANLIPPLVGRVRMIGHRFEDSCVRDGGAEAIYWKDVGTIDSYWEANIDLCQVTPPLNLYDRQWPIWTHQVQAPPAKFVFDAEGRRGTAVEAMVSGGCIISGAAVRRSLLFSDVRVHSYAVVEDSVVLPGADIGRRASIRRAIVEAGCAVPAGLVVGQDPELDARRFERTDNGVTLITQARIDALNGGGPPA